jgi:hypothetical protein
MTILDLVPLDIFLVNLLERRNEEWNNETTEQRNESEAQSNKVRHRPRFFSW